MWQCANKYLILHVTHLQASLLYTWLVVFLALFSFSFLLFSLTPYAAPEVLILDDLIDLYVAYVFLIDFLLGLFFNADYKNKLVYWRENWLNLLSSIPIHSEFTQLLRIARIWPAIRVIRVEINVWTARDQVKRGKT